MKILGSAFILVIQLNRASAEEPRILKVLGSFPTLPTFSRSMNSFPYCSVPSPPQHKERKGLGPPL